MYNASPGYKNAINACAEEQEDRFILQFASSLFLMRVFPIPILGVSTRDA